MKESFIVSMLGTRVVDGKARHWGVLYLKKHDRYYTCWRTHENWVFKAISSYSTAGFGDVSEGTMAMSRWREKEEKGYQLVSNSELRAKTQELYEQFHLTVLMDGLHKGRRR